jgi:hypothetical protein
MVGASCEEAFPKRSADDGHERMRIRPTYEIADRR